MQAGESGSPRPDLAQWSEEGHQNAVAIADMLGVSRDEYAADPLALLAALQDYVSRLPLGEFEQSDWYTLHSDLASYLADVLIRRRGAVWSITEDSAAPRGFRYVLEATGIDGDVHQVDPYDVVMEEFRNLPVEIARLISNAEVALGVTHLMRND